MPNRPGAQTHRKSAMKNAQCPMRNAIRTETSPGQQSKIKNQKSKINSGTPTAAIYPVTPGRGRRLRKKGRPPGDQPPCIRQTKKDIYVQPVRCFLRKPPAPAHPPFASTPVRALGQSKIKNPLHEFSQFLTSSHEFSRILTDSHESCTISRYFSLFLANSRYEHTAKTPCPTVNHFWPLPGQLLQPAPDASNAL
jgi:hypothetical protein